MVLRDDDDVYWRRDIEQRLSALEGSPQLGWSSITEGGIQVKQNGAERIRLGIDDDGRACLIFFEADGSELLRIGELPAGREGLEVYNSAGVAQIRAGELQSGGYGLEAISGAVAVTLAALGFGQAGDYIAASCGMTSTTFGDPTSGADGPSATVTIGSSGRLFVVGGAGMVVNSGDFPRVSVALSGANTLNPVSGENLAFAGNSSANAGDIQASGAGGRLYEGLNAGVTVVTMKYRSSTGSSCDFQDRWLIAFPL